MVEEAALRLGIDSRPAKAGAKEFVRSAEDIKRAAEKMQPGFKKVDDAFDKMKKAANDNTRSLDRNRRSMDAFARRARAMAGSTVSAFGRMRRAVLRLRTAFLALGIAIAGGIFLKAFADFESGLIDVQKTTDLTDRQLQKLGLNIEDIARRVPVSTTGLLELAAASGQLGVRGVDNITAFTDTMAKLEIATDLAGQEAARTFARILIVTKTPLSSVSNLGSAIVGLGNNFATTEREIADAGIRVAQAVAQFGGAFRADQVLALATAYRSIGVESELAGSATLRIFKAIQDATMSASDTTALFTAVVGETRQEFNQLLKENPAEAFTRFAESLGELNLGQRAQVLKELRLEGVRIAPVLLTLAENTDLVRDAFNQANKDFKENTAATEEADRKAKSLTSQWQFLRTEVKGLAKDIGEKLAPEVSESTGQFKEWIKNLRESQGFDTFLNGVLTLFALIKNTVTGILSLFDSVVRGAQNAIEKIKSLVSSANDTVDLGNGLTGRIAATVPLTPDMLGNQIDPSMPKPDKVEKPDKDLPFSSSDTEENALRRIADTVDELTRKRGALTAQVEAEARGISALADELGRQAEVEELILSLGDKATDLDKENIRNITTEISLLEERQSLRREENDRLKDLREETTEMGRRAKALDEWAAAQANSGKSSRELADDLEIVNEALDKRIDLLSEDGKAWRKNAEDQRAAGRASEEVVEAQKKAEDSIKDRAEAANEVINDLKRTAGDSFKDVIKGTESVSDAFGNMVDRIHDMLLDLALEELLVGGTGFSDVVAKLSGGSLGPAGANDNNPDANATPGGDIGKVASDIIFNKDGTIGGGGVEDCCKNAEAVLKDVSQNAKSVSDVFVEDGGGWVDSAKNVFVEDGGGWTENAKGVFNNEGGGFLDGLGGIFNDGISGLSDIFASLFSSGGGGKGNLLGQAVNIGLSAYSANSGGTAGSGSVASQLAHQGGIAGAGGPRRTVSPLAFAGAQRFHNGGLPGIKPNEVPAILERGERVQSKKDVAAGNGGGGNVTVHVNFPNATNTNEARQAGSEIAAKAGAAVRRGVIRKGRA